MAKGQTMKQGVIEAYQEDQLVVDLANLDVVRDALHEREIGVADEEHSEQLGLALLTLADVATVAAKLREDDSEMAGRITGASSSTAGPERAEPSDLDLIIFWLRESFGSTYAGWVPVIGKNRVVEPVKGLPYVGGGGEGDPYLDVRDPRSTPRASGGLSAGAPGPAAAPPVWPQRASSPGEGVHVGVLDTRLYPNPWLDGGYFAAEDDLLKVAAPGSEPRPATAGHATFVAGLILHGAPGAELIIRPVLNEQAYGTAWGVAKHMASFIGSGVDILNLSFGCFTDDGEPPLVLARAVSLLSAEILLVAAAGNHGNVDELRAKGTLVDASWAKGLHSNTPMWPAAFSEVTAVGATDGDNLAPFSPIAPWVDVTMPGVDVESTYLTGEVKLESSSPQGSTTATFSEGFAYWDGTSFAAAAVTGAVAAKIRPGHHDARQALTSILASPEGEIREYRKPGLVSLAKSSPAT
jgi:membrane-anchored mycosin MYCP